MRTPTIQDRIDATKYPADETQVMHQKWRELLFLHWQYDVETIQKTLPDGLQVDTHDGKAYIGIVPFYMRNIRPRFVPSVPGISNFYEMNVRTYVHDHRGVPGVWFYSLDASQPLAVRVARTLFHLPYFDARMEARESGSPPTVDYRCWRKNCPESEQTRYVYQGDETLPLPAPGSLEYFFAERYVLFSYHPRKNRIYSGRVHHTAYPLQSAAVESYSPVPLVQAGFAEPLREPDFAHYSKGVDVAVFPLQAVPPS